MNTTIINNNHNTLVPWEPKETVQHKLALIFENHIATGNEDMAVEWIENGFPCSKDTLIKACEMGLDKVLNAIAKNNLFNLENINEIITYCSEKTALALFDHDFPFSQETLKTACLHGRMDFLQAFSKKYNNCFDIIHHFIESNQEAQAITFLKAGFSFSKDTLLLACNHHLLDLAAVLIEKGACVADLLGRANSFGRTFLHHAAIGSGCAFIRLIIPHITPDELKTQLHRPDRAGYTPLDYAVKKNCQDASQRKLCKDFTKLLVDAIPEIAVELEQIAQTWIHKDFQHYQRYRMSLKKIVPNSPLLPRFKTREEGDSTTGISIHLLGKDPEILKNSWESITAYTKKIDPSLKMGECKIERVTNKEDLEEGFAYFIPSIQHILPESVHSIYGKAPPPDQPRNCHGAALVVSGIDSDLEHYNSPLCHPFFEEKTNNVFLKDIKLGDWVFLEEGPEGTLYPGIKGRHSFIYLSDDLCLSMNGMQRKLKFYTTQAVLNLYGFPAKALDPATPDPLDKWQQYVVIYRKKEDC